MAHPLCWSFSSWELASALKESKAKFDSAGVKLIAVGVGPPDKARILAERVSSLSFNCRNSFYQYICMNPWSNYEYDSSIQI